MLLQTGYVSIIFYGLGLKVRRRQPSGRYALCALLHAIIRLRRSAVDILKKTISRKFTQSLANEFDAGTVSGSPGEGGVPCNEWRIERFGKSDVSRIVGCQVAPERPDSKEENVVRVTIQGQISEVAECLLAPLGVHFAGEGVAPQDLSNLEIEQMRGVQCFVATEQPLGYPPRYRCVEQHLQ